MSRLWLSLQDPLLCDRLRAQWLKPLEVCALDAHSVMAQWAQGATGVWVVQVGPGHALTPESLARAIERSPGRVQILVLLPPSMHADGVRWLDAGADRCLPLGLDEPSLAAMLRVLERRARGQAVSVSEWAPMRFDHRTSALSIQSRTVPLTHREAQVMSLMMRRVGKMVSRQELLQELGVDPERFLRSSVVQLSIHRLNRKLAPSGVRIDGLKRLGYVLRIPLHDRPATCGAWQAPAWDGAALGQALAGAMTRQPVNV